MISRFKVRPAPVLQSEATECGLACLCMISQLLGQKLELKAVRLLWSASKRGNTLKDVLQIAVELGLKGRALRLELPQVRRHAKPLLIHWNFDHYVVLEDYVNGSYLITDPAVGRVKVDERTFSEAFTGIAVSFRLDGRQDRDLPKILPRLSLAKLWPRTDGQLTIISVVLLTTLLIQASILSSPIITSHIVDTAISAGDTMQIFLTSSILGLLLVISVILKAVRRNLLLSYSHLLSKRLAGRVVSHVLALPISWFSTRHVGDVMSRVSSATSIQEVALNRGLSAAVDTLIFFPAIFYLATISVPVAVIISVGLLFIAGVQVFSGGYLRQSARRRLLSRAESDSTLVEMIEGIEPVRVRSGEVSRYNIWYDRYLAMLNAERAFEQVDLWSEFGVELVVALATLGIILSASLAVVAGSLSVGQLISLVMIFGILTTTTARFVAFLREMSAAIVHVDNVSEVLQAPTAIQLEATPAQDAARASPVASELTIELDRVTHAYSDWEDPILMDVSLRIQPGETLGIVGRSGAGKSSLFKIMVGLMQPTSGRLMVNGVPLSENNRAAYQSRIGVVLQNDRIFRGTIADNIAFFDDFPDFDRISEAAKLCEIDEEIRRLPLAYNTPVGEGGAPLSGGQEQRIMLARALYGKPSVIFFDEGTAHLDTGLESQVHRNLVSLNLTRVIITHRPQTLEALGARICEMRDGRLIEAGLRAKIT